MHRHRECSGHKTLIIGICIVKRLVTINNVLCPPLVRRVSYTYIRPLPPPTLTLSLRKILAIVWHILFSLAATITKISRNSYDIIEVRGIKTIVTVRIVCRDVVGLWEQCVVCTTEDDRKSRWARAGKLHRFPREDDLRATGNFFRSRGPRRWRKNLVECCPAAIIPILAVLTIIYLALRHNCAYIV